MFKRNPKTSFGGYYAFPGGVVEKQDQIEKWKQEMPEFYNRVGSRFQDFPKRMCALRELFEETNLLYSRKDPESLKTVKYEEPTLANYNQKFKEDFISFSKASGIVPDID